MSLSTGYEWKKLTVSGVKKTPPAVTANNEESSADSLIILAASSSSTTSFSSPSIINSPTTSSESKEAPDDNVVQEWKNQVQRCCEASTEVRGHDALLGSHLIVPGIFWLYQTLGRSPANSPSYQGAEIGTMAEDCSLAIFWSPDGFNSSLTPSLQEGCTIGEFHFTFLLQPLNTPPSGSRLPLANVIKVVSDTFQSGKELVCLLTALTTDTELAQLLPIKFIGPQLPLPSPVPNCAGSKCIEPPIKYCPSCQACYCNKHLHLVHSVPVKNSHESSYQSVESYKEIVSKVEQAQLWFPREANLRTVSEDINQRFLEYNFAGRLSIGPQFALLSGGEENIPIAAVIGPTASGKSTILRALLQGAEHLPLPAFESSRSCSTDLNAYMGSIGDKKCIVIDSEGIGGSYAPSMSSRSMTAIATNRKPVVEKSYPRFLYLCSSVVVYISKGSSGQREMILKELVSYAVRASAGTVNQRTLPSLIIVFNQAQSLASTEDDISVTAKRWLDLEDTCGLVTKLKEYYGHIGVVFLPIVVHTSPTLENIAAFSSRCELLRNSVLSAIDDCTKREAQLTKPDVLAKISHFSRLAMIVKELDRSINKDALDIAAIDAKLRPFPRNSEQCMMAFFDTLYDAGKSSSKRQRWQKAKSILEKLLLHFFSFYVFEKTGQYPTKQSKERTEFSALLTKLSGYINNRRCCAAINNDVSDTKGIECDQEDMYHGDVHVSQDPRKGARSHLRWTTAFTIFEGSGGMAELGGLLDQLLNKIPDNRLLKPEHITCLESVLNMGKLSLPLRFCPRCCIRTPNEVRICQHNCCSRCLVEEPYHCSICNAVSGCNYHPHPSLAGVRVLALSGGGVRGIVSLRMMCLLEELVYQIPARELFDFIAGTSAGGISACGLVVKTRKEAKTLSAEAGMKTYKTLCKTSFSNTWRYTLVKGVANILDFLPRRFGFSIPDIVPAALAKTRYSRKGLDEGLRTALSNISGDVPMLFGSRPHVAVTAVTTVPTKGSSSQQTEETIQQFQDHKLVTRLMASYIGFGEDPKEDTIVDFNLVEVANCTSAAPTYFPVYHAPNGLTFADGGLMENNPSRIALQEVDRLWKNSRIDTLVSLGTGHCPGEVDNELRDSAAQWANLGMFIATNSEKIWSDVKKVPQLQGRAFGLNPAFQRDYPLNAYQQMEKMVDEVNSIFGDINRLNTREESDGTSAADLDIRSALLGSARHLTASLFYIAESSATVSSVVANQVTYELCGVIALRHLSSETSSSAGFKTLLDKIQAHYKIGKLVQFFDVSSGKEVQPSSLVYDSTNHEIRFKVCFSGKLSIKTYVGCAIDAEPLAEPVYISGSPFEVEAQACQQSLKQCRSM